MDRSRLSVMIVVALLAAVPVLAQEAPTVGDAQPVNRVVPVLIALFLLVCIAVVAFISPRRGD